AIIAPGLWSFHYHHIIVPVLFFASLALWLQLSQKNDFLSGLATGAMLMKPHLLVVAAVFLFLHAAQKSRFLLGLSVIVLIQLIPFLGFRPISDLRTALSNQNHLATEVYFCDDQNIASLFFRQFYAKTHPAEYMSTDGIQGRLVNPKAILRLNQFKGA